MPKGRKLKREEKKLRKELKKYIKETGKNIGSGSPLAKYGCSKK